LERWGFTPQKPLQRSFEQNPKSTRRWLSKEYLELIKRAKREGALVYWGSETWLRSDRLIGKSYGLKGYLLDYFLEAQPLRGRMVSAITNRGQLCFMVYDEPYCAGVILDFMERLVQIKRKKVYLIVDNHSAHRSQIVNQWLQENYDLINLKGPALH
jgi:hypothetical protein